MMKLSQLARVASDLSSTFVLLSLVAITAGCDSDLASDPPPSSGNPPIVPTAIQGIATPSSVAVVTATNAD